MIPIIDHKYLISWTQETAWGVVLGAIAVVGPMVMALDADTVGVWGAEDWKTWGLAVAVAVGRVTIAIIVNSVRQAVGAKEPPDA